MVRDFTYGDYIPRRGAYRAVCPWNTFDRKESPRAGVLEPGGYCFFYGSDGTAGGGQGFDLGANPGS